MSIQPFDRSLYTKKVNIKDLRVEDTLAHDIYLLKGPLVMKAGTIITEDKLQKLKQLCNSIVTLDLTKVYINALDASKAIMYKAAKDTPIGMEDVKMMLDPLIQSSYREKNAAKLLLNLQVKDEYTFQHTINIGILSLIIGKWVGLSGDKLTELAIAGSLHDIGKSKIPLGILNKPGPLTKIEYEAIKKHAPIGYDLLKKCGSYSEAIMQTVLQHHEREDGKGYPYGLKSADIHYYAKIVAVADTYHAMTSNRVYKAKNNPYLVLDHLLKNLGSLDPEIVLIFTDHMVQYLQACQVRLSNGSIGDVVFIDKKHIKYPIIKMRENQEIINLAETSNLRIVDILDSPE